MTAPAAPAGEEEAMKGDKLYNWVRDPRSPDGRLHGVGIMADGTLRNPNGYPEDLVREAVEAAEARKHAKRSRAAKRGAETKAKRRELNVARVIQQIADGKGHSGRRWCAICHKALKDPQSIERGIGPECWDGIARLMEIYRAEKEAAAEEAEP
jgi:hypothetical protein